MAACDYCGTSILFGGIKEEGYRFCSEDCHGNGFLLALADRIPPEMVQEYQAEMKEGACPNCGGPGPVDLHTSHTVWSILVMTSWASHPKICCNSCGFRSKLGSFFISGLFGWWGLPWGIIMTPVQLCRNVYGMIRMPNPNKPSAEMLNILRLNLAAEILMQEQEAEAAGEIPPSNNPYLTEPLSNEPPKRYD